MCGIVERTSEARTGGYRTSARADDCEVRIVRWWLNELGGTGIIFSLVIGAVVALYHRRADPASFERLDVKVLSAIFILIEVGVVFLTLRAILNRTTVTLRPSTLEVRSGPFPPWSRRVIPRDQLATVLHVKRTDNDGDVTHDVDVIQRSGERWSIAENIEMFQAQFIAQRIQERLGQVVLID